LTLTNHILSRREKPTRIIISHGPRFFVGEPRISTVCLRVVARHEIAAKLESMNLRADQVIQRIDEENVTRQADYENHTDRTKRQDQDLPHRRSGLPAML
jgi:hypothetical protein